MSLEISIKECTAGLTSIRATERKKNAESMKDFLMRNAVPSLLSENTIKKKGYTWNDVFDDINELILKETEKFESSKSFETVMGPLCTSLLHLCVSGSNKGKAFIKCEKIIEACLFILKDKRLTKAVGDAYLNLLYKYILPCDHYLSYITPTAWEELLDVSLSICISKQCKMDDFTKFRFLLLVIKNGTNSSQFVIPLRDAVPKLKMSFLRVAENKKVQEVTIEIMIVLLETLSLECRLTMCEFTETLLNSVLKFYDQNFDQKKKSSLFKLLQLAVVLHHPQGRKENEEGSLANDWGIWNKQLHNILEIICLEATHLQKSRKQYDILLNHCNEYFYLAAPVYYQIFNLEARTNDDDENGNSSKKQRVTINKNKSFSDLIEECKQNHVPWLAIIHMYIKHYGQSVSEADYVSLISVMGSLITSTNNSLNWEIIDEMARLNIHHLTAHNSTNEHDVSIISLWNSCVRTCTVISADAHKAVHSIIQLLLSLETVKYQNVQPLIKLYFENGMPVTDHSVNTLSHVFHKFFNKCSHFNERIKYFTWLIQGQITSLDVKNIQGLLLRLLASENINLMQISNASSESDKMHDVLLNSIEKSTLFSEFEIDIPKPHTTIQEQPQQQEHTEINIEVNKEVSGYFNMQLLDLTKKVNKQEITLLEYIQFNCIILAYVDIILKYNFAKRDHINEEQIYWSLKEALKLVYDSLTDNLRHSTQSSVQIALLKCVQNMLVTDYDPLLNIEIRSCISEDFFYCINNILNREVSTEDAETLYEGDEINPNASRHQCICLLAAYCRLRINFRDEILELITDPKLYNFNITWDIDCAVECIELLYHEKVEDPPLESIFTLMQGMCKDLFRNSDASFKILKILVNIIDKIWSNDNSMRQNCYIMVKSYLLRCEKMYYPPRVVALVYECAAKITLLNLEQSRDVDNIFLEAIMEKIRGTSHTLRLYCCYLLRPVMVHLSDADTQSYLEGLMEIFTIKVSERNESILKDESSNRTLTVLHCFYALAQTRNALINKIVPEIMQIQKEKSLDTNLVKKVMNRITEMITKTSIDVYANDNILAILNFWFEKNNCLESLPLFLFGISNMDAFLEKHVKWLIAADILWRKGGIVKDSDVLRQVQIKSGKTVDYLIEMCICNILVLCLPYIVTEKYRLSFTLPGKREWSANASKMFLLTRQILGDMKWSSVFVTNMSELVMLIATHLNDHVAAKEDFEVNIPKQTKSYHYPKEVFSAILNEIGGLIDENVLEYHCENQPLVIFKTLFKLWENVLKENVFEYKVLSLHTFITFLQSVPLGYPSDAVVWNFTCNSLGHATRVSQNKDEIRVFTKALKIILQRLLPEKVDMLRKAVSQVLSILMIKKEEGFHNECSPLMNYLVIDMKDCLKESEDVIDFITPVSQVKVENVNCSSMAEFKAKLKMFKKSLSCSSHETLLTMRQFFKQNKQYVNKLSDEINAKGFSDDCGTSIIHQIIFSLSNTLKSASDDKTKIESCNCLAEIGNYHLKTLVTVPPANTQTVIDIRPKQYFAIVVMKSLSDILFDENPVVTSGVARTLRSLLKYREGKVALDLEEDKQILTPFSTSDCKTFAEFKINEEKFNAMCASVQWIPNNNENHCQWLTRMTVALLGVLASSSNYLKDLRAVCALKPSLCQKLLPPSLGLLLECSSEHKVQIIGEQIDKFFKYIWEMYFDHAVENSNDSISCTKTNHNLNQDHKMIVQYMLDIVNFVRLQRSHYTTRPDRTVETLNYLRLEYDKVAWAATIADQNLAAIYYGELWASAQNGGVPPPSPEATTNLTGGENVQNIFRKCFVSIGELDAVDGCGTAHLTSEDEKRKHLINTSQYSDALLLHDIALSYGPQIGSNLHNGVVKSLHKSGMHHLALQYIKSLPENDELNDIKYECLSFLGDWSDFVDTRELEEKSKQANHNPNSALKALRYSCLKDCLNLQTTPDIETKLVLPLNQAKLSVARLCQNQNMENCQSVYKVLTKLHLFRDIEDYFSVRSNKSSAEGLLDQWQVDKLPSFQDFQHLETLISQRSLILDHAAKVYGNSLKNIASLQLQYAELSLSNQRVQMAQRLLAVVKKHQTCEEVALVDSQISWAKGHKDIALSLLRNIVAHPSPDVKLNAISLRQYGLWMAESKCDNARDIINKYLKKSLEVLDANNHQETRLKVYYDIAKFADAEYKQVVSYMASSIFEKKVKCAESMKGTALSLKSTKEMTKDERKALNANQKFGQIDAAEIASTRVEKESFLHLAMRYYLLSLKQGESNNLSVFRVISLWLDNPNIELTDSEQSSFEELLHGIPSWKYVTVLPQLTPRLTNENNTFAENLRRIIKRCALEHPHHTLPILFSLRNSNKDRQLLNASENVGGSTQRLQSQEPRVVAADNIISQLAQENSAMALIISQMAKMSDAIISFANYEPQKKEPKQKIPSAERIHRLGHLDSIPIPTVTIPISHDCKYAYMTSLYSFENYFELVGGINCPKKIICKGSDGIARIVLVKGQDDLRQDAVMQQVFNIVNTLLENNPVTSRNKLLIRTYKVVPMSRRSGVLEWCEGTMPIGTYLIGGGGGAHARYRPTDISFAAARGKLVSFHEQRKSNQEKLAVYIKIMKQFRPVFHYFFTEHYLDPVTWYERRLAYTKSVATSSMVGYILGLGDRHLQNILIDKKSAEVVHIDFGISFDQGKTLPTPETIPFRLTQDIVAGFGSCGVEGIFRRCCEKTMQLLRDNQETLLTILEVLLCDPLYSWTVTSKQQNVLPATSGDISVNQVSGSEGSLAKRALLSVSSKLNGTEGGIAGGVAVPGQVARLIHTAMDPANLCRLYPGWQPYL